MPVTPAEIAERGAALGGSTAVVRVIAHEEIAVHCGPDGALRPPRRRSSLRVQMLVRDGAGRRGLAEMQLGDDLGALAELAERARAIAAGSPVDLRPFPVPAPGGSHEGYDADTATLEIGRAVAAARAAASATEFALGRGREAIARAEVLRTAVASSEGVVTDDQRTATSVEARCTDDDGRLVGHGQHVSPSTALLDPVGAGLAATPPQCDWEPAPSALLRGDEYPVILRPAAAAPLLCALADAACTGPAHATGTSPYTGRLGTEVASPLLTLLDSPRYPAHPGPRDRC